MTHDDLVNGAARAVAENPTPADRPPTAVTLVVAFDGPIHENVLTYARALLAQDVESFLLSCASDRELRGVMGAPPSWGMGRANVVGVTAPDDVEDLPDDVLAEATGSEPWPTGPDGLDVVAYESARDDATVVEVNYPGRLRVLVGEQAVFDGETSTPPPGPRPDAWTDTPPSWTGGAVL